MIGTIFYTWKQHYRGWYGVMRVIQHLRIHLLVTAVCAQYFASIFSEMFIIHYNDVTMDAIASQITSLTIVYSTVYSDADQRKHQSSSSPAFVWGIHSWPVNSPHKWPVTRNMFPFDDVIMNLRVTYSVPFASSIVTRDLLICYCRLRLDRIIN